MTNSSLDNLVWEQENPSGFAQLLGYKLVEWEKNRAVLEMPLGPTHSNRAGLPHGGLLTTLLDTASGYAGCFCPVAGHVRRTLTLSLTTNYVGQARGSVLRATGTVIGGGRKIFFTSAEVTDDRGTMIATATGTFRYHKGSEDETGHPRTD